MTDFNENSGFSLATCYSYDQLDRNLCGNLQPDWVKFEQGNEELLVLDKGEEASYSSQSWKK